ncbi:MAG: T9SS type A sorting domain-containing protein, partial [Bacteroidales bacterium]|nr:T9SS type A sorting domain-containing protein [Bacteroidales bacterium]
VIYCLNIVERVILMSYNPDKLKRIRQKDDQVRLVLISNTIIQPQIEYSEEIEAYGISTSIFTPTVYISTAHNAGLKFWSGLISDPVKAVNLGNSGVDAIITDNPSLFISINRNFVNVYPNPFSHQVTFVFDKNCLEKEMIIYSMEGKIVARFTPVSEEEVYTPDNLPAGLYFLYSEVKETFIFEKILYLPSK